MYQVECTVDATVNSSVNPISLITLILTLHWIVQTSPFRLHLSEIKITKDSSALTYPRLLLVNYVILSKASWFTSLHNYILSSTSCYSEAAGVRRLVWRFKISFIDRMIVMTFLATKMDSSLLNLNTITKRMIKNAKFTPVISKMFHRIAVRFLCLPFSLLCSTICHGQSSKLKQATTIMDLPNSFEIP